MEAESLLWRREAASLEDWKAVEDWKAADFPGFVALLQVADWPAWDAADDLAEWGFVDCFEAVAAVDPFEMLGGGAFGGRWASSYGSLVAAVTVGSSFGQPVPPDSVENLASASACPRLKLPAEVTQWFWWLSQWT